MIVNCERRYGNRNFPRLVEIGALISTEGPYRRIEDFFYKGEVEALESFKTNRLSWV